MSTPPHAPESGHRRTGWLPATMLVIASMIGVGVFTSLGFQVGGLPSGFVILLLWTVGGLAALCGAFCYAELAAMRPGNGGEAHMLSWTMHPAFGFMAGVVSLVAGFAGPAAVSVLALGYYVGAVWEPAQGLWLPLAVLVVFHVLHCFNVRASGWLQVIVTSLKMILVVGFAVVGFVLGPRDGYQGPGFGWQEGDLELIFSPAFAISLFYVAFAYSGWNAAAYIAGEVHRPQRTVTVALVAGTAFVLIVYVALNAMMLRAVPMAELNGVEEVGERAAVAIFGERGGGAMSLAIGLGLASMASAMAWAGPRVAQAVGERVSGLRVLARTNRGGVPVIATMLQLLLAVILLLVFGGRLEEVLRFCGVALTLCSSLTIGAMLWWRWKRPEEPRPMRCPLFPLPPLAYLALSGWMFWWALTTSPKEGLAGLGLLAVGLALGWWFSRPAAEVKIGSPRA